jgi:hypothetical protein
MRTANSGTMRGTRVGAGPAGEPDGRVAKVAKVAVLYHCANGHRTTVPFIWTATPPPYWECRVCSEPAGTDPIDPPAADNSRAVRYLDEKTQHLGRVRDRRTQADGDRLMAESLRRRDHPEEFDIWAKKGRSGLSGRSLPPARRLPDSTSAARVCGAVEGAAVRAGRDAGMAFEQGPQVCGGAQPGQPGHHLHGCVGGFE